MSARRALQMRGPQVYKGNVSGKQVNFDNLSKLPGFKRQQGMKMPVGPLMPRQAAFVQKPFLPWWIALIIPLLILIGIILWLLWPRNITVPDVRPQADVRAAEKILKDKKLRLDKTDKKVVADKAQIGKILDQAPSPGKKVKEGTGVTVVVGVGNGKVEVPDLKGKSIKDVSTLLPEAEARTRGDQAPGRGPGVHRPYVGYDLDEAYVAIARQRVAESQASGILAPTDPPPRRQLAPPPMRDGW